MLKDKRGVTIKRRLDYPQALYGTLDERALAHIEASYRTLYGEPFPHLLAPLIEMRYAGITRVAKAGGERMTIDGDLEYFCDGERRRIAPGLFIVETQSARGNGLADRILRDAHPHPTARCSKYCVGMAAMEQVACRNKFLPALRKLGLSDAPAAPRARNSGSRRE